MRFPRLLAGVGLLFAFYACGSQPAQDTARDVNTTPDGMNDTESGSQLVAALLTAWNNADTTAFASMIAEDAVYMAPDGPAVEGRDAVVSASVANYDVGSLQQTATADEFIMVGDKAYGRGTWQLNTRADGEVQHGKWSAIYTRGSDGSWQIWRWMWNQPSETAGDTSGR